MRGTTIILAALMVTFPAVWAGSGDVEAEGSHAFTENRATCRGGGFVFVVGSPQGCGIHLEGLAEATCYADSCDVRLSGTLTSVRGWGTLPEPDSTEADAFIFIGGGEASLDLCAVRAQAAEASCAFDVSFTTTRYTYYACITMQFEMSGRSFVSIPTQSSPSYTTHWSRSYAYVTGCPQADGTIAWEEEAY